MTRFVDGFVGLEMTEDKFELMLKVGQAWIVNDPENPLYPCGFVPIEEKDRVNPNGKCRLHLIGGEEEDIARRISDEHRIQHPSNYHHFAYNCGFNVKHILNITALIHPTQKSLLRDQRI